MREAITQNGQSLYQPLASDINQGAVTFSTPSGRPIIDLFTKANASTFLHESGHTYFEALKQMAAAPDAPPQIKEIWTAAQAGLYKLADSAATRANQRGDLAQSPRRRARLPRWRAGSHPAGYRRAHWPPRGMGAADRGVLHGRQDAEP
jgi:hypothetical protein